jgi:hypothetical protein
VYPTVSLNERIALISLIEIYFRFAGNKHRSQFRKTKLARRSSTNERNFTRTASVREGVGEGGER